ncbi:tRNA preQ1(34) S-adenosylmethionine ribosyltransferase-isomerase QueA [Candidatus Woesearchaeota archaeon]|nr:tRNA preQ1(34) S-adenosylmethionine ribosyltransferase-isomerase QueA [Candidatus Woesearchaeota archaeon]
MLLSDFDYDLPKELIAQRPLDVRSSSKLMICSDNHMKHTTFDHIIDYLQQGDVLVLNNTKVKQALLHGNKASGGKIEILVGEKKENGYLCSVKGKHLKEGAVLQLAKGYQATVIEKREDKFLLTFSAAAEKIMNDIGQPPLPPYIKQTAAAERYQTVYAKQLGSIAAPTAGLHLTPTLLEEIRKKGVPVVSVTLHVSYATFNPIKTEQVEDHRMQQEEFEISKAAADTINRRKGRMFVVGTTSLKTLESSCDDRGRVIPQRSLSSLFIYPGHQFKVKIDGLVTNFHLPKSTLLLLVSAYFGKEKIMHAYAEAIKHSYRFFSFGDAMLLLK